MKYLDLNGLDYFWGKIKRYIELDSVHRVEMGAPNGVATLDSAGLVPASQLPSYVDDVLEFTSISQFPQTGEKDKIYVDLSSNLIYRWSGTQYIEISKSLALGETSTTAYAGDKGKANRLAIESLPNTIITRIQPFAYSTDLVQLTIYDVDKDGLNYESEDSTIYELKAASQGNAGVMTATDKTQHDSLWTYGMQTYTLNHPDTTITAVSTSGEGVQVTLNPRTQLVNGKVTENTFRINVPLATSTTNGVMSAQDKSRLDSAWGNSLSNVDINKNGATVSFNSTSSGMSTTISPQYTYVDGATDSEDLVVNIPLVSTTANGIMSSGDKTEHDSLWSNAVSAFQLNQASNDITAQDVGDDGVRISLTSKTTKVNNLSSTYTTQITVPLATTSSNGVMSAEDKVRLNSLASELDWNNLINKPSWLQDDICNWGDILGKPSTYTPAEHTHTISQITDFPTFATINGKRIDQGGDIETTVVSFSRSLSSGTKIGTITIDGSATEIFAPLPEETVTYSQATSSTLGLVKIGYSSDTTNHGVVLNSNGQMYVTIQSISNSTIDDICV